MQLDSGFVPFDPVHLTPTGAGVLNGTRFASKDIIDIAGRVTGNGHPLWRRTHGPAARSATCVERLLAAGGELVGKTHTDEFAYSLAGQNVHYGTPPNPAAPGRIPGGSSSGSASVVAAGLVDFALGTDTGGSIRIPASYCGLYGLRPTHGTVDNAGVTPLAERFDTVGWLARDPGVMQAVGQVLLPQSQRPPLRRLRLITAAMDATEERISRQVRELIKDMPLTHATEVTFGPPDAFANAFRTVQGFQAWAHFGPWIKANRPDFGPGVRERFAAAEKVTVHEAKAAFEACGRLQGLVRAPIGDDTVLCLPTAPVAAPSVNASPADVDDVRFRTLCMTAIAGIGGLPQLSLPLLRGDGGPIGLSLIGPPGSDLQLLELAVTLAGTSPPTS
ncbi:MAG: amidase [Aquisalimonadaceae bacterium]